MTEIMAGRYTAETEEPFVVFVIGMRVNKLRAFRKWLPVAQAMGPMLRTLYQHPEKGFMGAQTYLNWRGITMIQYWRSFEDLEKFAKDASDPHLEAWRRFNKAVGSDGTVGIWHETYRIEPNHHEAIYGNMPVWGLASATKHVPIGKKSQTARRRMEQAKETGEVVAAGTEV